jgi:hypothetical protein
MQTMTLNYMNMFFNSHADSTHLVSDDEQDEDSTTANANDNQVTNDFTYSETREENIADFFTKELPTQPTNIIEDEDEPLSAKSPQAELLHRHYRLGHLPFACLRILSLIGTIPKCLLTVKALKCAGCMYGAITKQPWRMKGIQNKNKIRVATSPGDCISVNQLESLTPGFIAQLKGRLTKKRYGAATIFIDHANKRKRTGPSGSNNAR